MSSRRAFRSWRSCAPAALWMCGRPTVAKDGEDERGQGWPKASPVVKAALVVFQPVRVPHRGEQRDKEGIVGVADHRIREDIFPFPGQHREELAQGLALCFRRIADADELPHLLGGQNFPRLSQGEEYALAVVGFLDGDREGR